ncbi:MAG: hypothetical protein ACH37Z_02240 [Anaerolineae bacterium]
MHRVSALFAMIVIFTVSTIFTSRNSIVYAQGAGGGDGTSTGNQSTVTATPSNTSTATRTPTPTRTPLDYGDAPEMYDTLFDDDGARHELTGPKLGVARDGETDGKPSEDADEDGSDDADGVSFPPEGNAPVPILQSCTTYTLTVTTTGSGFLSAWMDRSENGFESNERIINHIPITGTAQVALQTECNPAELFTYVRFRLFDEDIEIASNGYLDAGEVEDYKILLADQDFGDAPNAFTTTLSVNGPRHIIPRTGDGPILANELFVSATERDREENGVPSGDADGDDGSGASVDDEGALVIGMGEGKAFRRLRSCVTNKLIIHTRGNGILKLWVDKNMDGDFNDENIDGNFFNDEVMIEVLDGCADLTCKTEFFVRMGTNDQCDDPEPIPTQESVQQHSYARVRFSSVNTMDTGIAPDGEVEDHYLPILTVDNRCGNSGSDSTPVIMVHGFSFDLHIGGVGLVADCEKVFNVVTDDLVNWGRSREDIHWVQYLDSDRSCTDDVTIWHEFGSDPEDNPFNGTPADEESPIERLSYHLAWYLHNNFNTEDQVDILAHSMGGLLVRHALIMSDIEQEGPVDQQEIGVQGERIRYPSLQGLVRNVMTVGTPHKGLSRFEIDNQALIKVCTATGGIAGFCGQLLNTSTFMKHVLNEKRLAHVGYPLNQGIGGANWTTVGSSGDSIVHFRSATGYSKATHKEWYDHILAKKLLSEDDYIEVEHDSRSDELPNLFYLYDTGCRHRQVVHSNDGGTEPRGFRCAENVYVGGGPVVGRAGRRTHGDSTIWIWQPNVNYHAFLALSYTNW